MKKQILMMFVAVLAVSFVSAGFAAPKKPVQNKTVAKKPSAKVPANVTLIKGIKISKCSKLVKMNGTITIDEIKNSAKIPVKNGKFDLILPIIPEFNDEIRPVEEHFGNSKVYVLASTHLKVPKSKELGDVQSVAMEGIIYYSDSDVTGSMYGEEIKLKKGWNIFDKTGFGVLVYCAEERGY